MNNLTPHETTEGRISEIERQLREIDLDRSRPLSDIARNVTIVYATKKLVELEEKRMKLVTEKAWLEKTLQEG